MQAFPYAAGTFCDVGVRAVPGVHLQISICTIGEDRSTARTEVGQCGDVLFGCQGRGLVHSNGQHDCLLALMCGSDRLRSTAAWTANLLSRQTSPAGLAMPSSAPGQ